MIIWMLGCLPVQRGDAVSLPPGELPTHVSQGSDSGISEHVIETTADYLADQEMPAIGVALVHQGQVCFSGGVGWADITAERPLDGDTPVLLSSVSKTFIGVTAMQGVEAGRLSLDEEINTHLGFEVQNPKVQEDITLLHLLTHNSGIHDSLQYGLSYAPGDPETPLPEFLEGYLVPKGDFYKRSNWRNRAPGEEFEYSNVGASLGAHIVGEAAGLPFSELVESDILVPLGMTHSAYLLTDLPVDPAVPYARTRNGDFKAWEQYGYPTYPDGMLRSSAYDMARYLAAIANEGTLAGTDPPALLPAERVEEMLTTNASYGTDEDAQAIVWSMRELDGVPMMGHNGGDFGSFTELWFDPETGDGFVLLATSSPQSGEALFAYESELMALAAACRSDSK